MLLVKFNYYIILYHMGNLLSKTKKIFTEYENNRSLSKERTKSSDVDLWNTEEETLTPEPQNNLFPEPTCENMFDKSIKEEDFVEISIEEIQKVENHVEESEEEVVEEEAKEEVIVEDSKEEVVEEEAKEEVIVEDSKEEVVEEECSNTQDEDCCGNEDCCDTKADSKCCDEEECSNTQDEDCCGNEDCCDTKADSKCCDEEECNKQVEHVTEDKIESEVDKVNEVTPTEPVINENEEDTREHKED